MLLNFSLSQVSHEVLLWNPETLWNGIRESISAIKHYLISLSLLKICG
jgi:hypothetical protein